MALITTIPLTYRHYLRDGGGGRQASPFGPYPTSEDLRLHFGHPVYLLRTHVSPLSVACQM